MISVRTRGRIKAKLSLLSDNNSNWLFAILENKILIDIQMFCFSSICFDILSTATEMF